MDELLEEHLKTLAQKPVDMTDSDYASFIEDHKGTCLLCNEKAHLDDPDERGDMEKNYTQAELEAAVAAAVTPLAAELDTIKNSAEVAEQEAKITQIQEEADQKVAEAEARVDTATVEANTAKTELAEKIAYLEKVKQDTEDAAAREALKTERTEAAAKANFPEDRIAERIDSWVAMSDEDWASTLEDWKAIPSAPAEQANEETLNAPLETAVENTRTTPAKTGALTDFLSRAGGNLNTI